jgi:hypothetical protein
MMAAAMRGAGGVILKIMKKANPDVGQETLDSMGHLG